MFSNYVKKRENVCVCVYEFTFLVSTFIILTCRAYMIKFLTFRETRDTFFFLYFSSHISVFSFINQGQKLSPPNVEFYAQAWRVNSVRARTCTWTYELHEKRENAACIRAIRARYGRDNSVWKPRSSPTGQRPSRRVDPVAWQKS